ncbi:MAG: carbohydrate porin [Phycisphaerae bacterium]|nr:carbohydrate porin [Phycisphaerae bacterium]
MNRTGFLGFWMILMSICAYAEHEHVWQQESLTNGFWGLNEALEPTGIETAFSATSAYQRNIKGGLSTDSRKGEFAGSYDLEVTFDLQRMLEMDGILFLHGEGGWTDSEGIDGVSVGSAFGVNADAIGNRSMDIVEFYYETAFWDNTFQLRIGKLDMTGGFECRGCPVSFDGNMYANDENTQFLNSALVNNPTIPFPDYGLGAIVHWNPVEDWYLSVGVADAQANGRETGFNTTFHDEDYFVYMAETGVTPHLHSGKGILPGAYRVGAWYDPQPKAHSDASKDYRDDAGLYVSCDQKLSNESNDPEDMQGLGGFFRYGYAHARTNDITHFYSFGIQYQGLLDGRDDDVLGLGYANGIFSDRADSTYTEDYESATELYYSAQVTKWMTLSPSVQYVTNPGGDSSVSDAVILGLRALVTF